MKPHNPEYTVSLSKSDWELLIYISTRYLSFERLRLHSIGNELNGLVKSSVCGDIQRAENISAKLSVKIRNEQKKYHEKKPSQLLLL